MGMSAFFALEVSSYCLSYHTDGTRVQTYVKVSSAKGLSITHDLLLEFVPVQTSRVDHIPLLGIWN